MFIGALFIDTKTGIQPRCPRWMDEYIVVHPNAGILFSIKKKWAIKPWKDMEES